MEGNFCASFFAILRLQSLLFRISLQRIFSHPKARRAPLLLTTRSLMLINLLPDFFAVLNSTDRIAAYHRYFDTHRNILQAYWANYVLDPDGPPFDDVLMVGVGAANAGELVVNGRGVAFVCLEHFTSITNPETHGLGLDPELIPLWLAHEIAHAVRYTSPESRSDMRQVIADMEGYYSYWETGKRVNLRELLVNEGISVQVSRSEAQ